MDVQKKSVSFTNVPKSVSERELRDLFGRMGRVIGFRLKQGFKGGAAATNYGEVDFTDVPTAENAARQLNGHMFGDKQMRVAHGVKTRKRRMPDRFGGGGGGGGAGDADGNQATLEFSRLQRTDLVKHALTGLPVDVAYEAVEQLRVLCLERPELAEELLRSNPQLLAASVLILQHAGRLPQHLPAEAFSANVALAAAVPGAGVGAAVSNSNGGDGAATAAASSSSTRDAAVLQLIEALDDEALEQILQLTDEELATMADEERAQLTLVRDYLYRATEQA